MAKVTTPPELKQSRFLVITGIGMFLTQIVSLMLAPLLVALATEFDVSVASAGQLAASSGYIRRKLLMDGCYRQDLYSV